MPTLKRLQQRHAEARMMWWQNGKLWNSRLDAQEAMHARGEMGRRGDERQTGAGFRNRQRAPQATGRQRPTWSGGSPERGPSGKLDWKPKGAGEPSERRSEWAPKSRGTAPKSAGKPAWKPKAAGARPERDWKAKSDWKPRGSGPGKPAWPPKPQAPPGRSHEKLEWQPKRQDSGTTTRDTRPPEKRKWVPKEEYKKSQGIEAKRDRNWRPGGEHKDPRQKYKDAKKAKWGRFKQTIRKRWEAKTGKKNDK